MALFVGGVVVVGTGLAQEAVAEVQRPAPPVRRAPPSQTPAEREAQMARMRAEREQMMQERQKMEWKNEFQRMLPLLGHRNWILVVDKAYPWQSGNGITTLYTGQPLMKTLEEVVGALKASTHAAPIFYTDKEMNFMTEDMTKGVDAYREQLKKTLEGMNTQSILHNDVFPKLDEAAKLFNILILKTDETIAYSSVFIELDCAYWGPEKEKVLREKMK